LLSSISSLLTVRIVTYNWNVTIGSSFARKEGVGG
jgi:hypothetical protein